MIFNSSKLKCRNHPRKIKVKDRSRYTIGITSTSRNSRWPLIFDGISQSTRNAIFVESTSFLKPSRANNAMRFVRYFVVGTQRYGGFVIGTWLLKIELPSSIRILINCGGVERPNLMLTERLEIGILVSEQCNDFFSGFHRHKLVMYFFD